MRMIMTGQDKIMVRHWSKISSPTWHRLERKLIKRFFPAIGGCKMQPGFWKITAKSSMWCCACGMMMSSPPPHLSIKSCWCCDCGLMSSSPPHLSIKSYWCCDCDMMSSPPPHLSIKIDHESAAWLPHKHHQLTPQIGIRCAWAIIRKYINRSPYIGIFPRKLSTYIAVRVVILYLVCKHLVSG